MGAEPDFGSTTTVLEKRAPGLAWLPRVLRQRLTPAVLGSAVTALAVAIAFVVNAQHELHTAQHDIDRQGRSISELQQQFQLLHEINTQLAVVDNKVDVIATEVDRQREWREKIEDAAESGPHARKRH
jgi:hypothetical protein